MAFEKYTATCRVRLGEFDITLEVGEEIGYDGRTAVIGNKQYECTGIKAAIRSGWLRKVGEEEQQAPEKTSGSKYSMDTVHPESVVGQFGDVRKGATTHQNTAEATPRTKSAAERVAPAGVRATLKVGGAYGDESEGGGSQRTVGIFSDVRGRTKASPMDTSSVKTEDATEGEKTTVGSLESVRRAAVSDEVRLAAAKRGPVKPKMSDRMAERLGVEPELRQETDATSVILATQGVYPGDRNYPASPPPQSSSEHDDSGSDDLSSLIPDAATAGIMKPQPVKSPGRKVFGEVAKRVALIAIDDDQDIDL